MSSRGQTPDKGHRCSKPSGRTTRRRLWELSELRDSRHNQRREERVCRYILRGVSAAGTRPQLTKRARKVKSHYEYHSLGLFVEFSYCEMNTNGEVFLCVYIQNDVAPFTHEPWLILTLLINHLWPQWTYTVADFFEFSSRVHFQ